MLNSSRTPVPIAVISAWISTFWRTLSMREFSTLRILPRSGWTACVLRSLPCLPEPAAESPSTTHSSARRRSFTAHVRAALARVDVVGERVNRLLVGGVPLHRDLRRALLGLAGEEDHPAVDGVLVLVEVGDEVLDAALVLEGGRVAFAALVDDRDL